MRRHAEEQEAEPSKSSPSPQKTPQKKEEEEEDKGYRQSDGVGICISDSASCVHHVVFDTPTRRENPGVAGGR